MMISPSRFLASGLISCGSVFAEIPAGYELVKITENPRDFSHWAHINNCGEVVFSLRFGNVITDEEIFQSGNMELPNQFQMNWLYKLARVV